MSTPTILGTAKVGQRLSIKFSSVPDTFRGNPFLIGVLVKWYANGKLVGTNNPYLVGQADVGKRIQAKVSISKECFITQTKLSSVTAPVAKAIYKFRASDFSISDNGFGYFDINYSGPPIPNGLTKVTWKAVDIWGLPVPGVVVKLTSDGQAFIPGKGLSLPAHLNEWISADGVYDADAAMQKNQIYCNGEPSFTLKATLTFKYGSTTKTLILTQTVACGTQQVIEPLGVHASPIWLNEPSISINGQGRLAAGNGLVYFGKYGAVAARLTYQWFTCTAVHETSSKSWPMDCSTVPWQTQSTLEPGWVPNQRVMVQVTATNDWGLSMVYSKTFDQ